MGGGHDPDIPWWKSFVAGNVGGVFGLLISYPFDTVRVRMQTEGMLARKASTSMLECAKQIMRKEGFRALYRGALAPCLGYGTVNAVAFATNDAVAQYFRTSNRGSGPASAGSKEPEISWVQLIIAGSAAGMTSSLVRGPVERIKTIMQVTEKPDGSKAFGSTLEAVRATVRQSGVGGVFRGTPSTMVREVIQFAMYYPAYHGMKALSDKHGGQYSWVAVPLMGGLAGAIQWLPPSYCIDVVKSRMQADQASKYKGMVDCARQSLAAEGPLVFFRGLGPALIRAFPLHAGVFSGYEFTLMMLR